jgi:hypothetical protein
MSDPFPESISALFVLVLFTFVMLLLPSLQHVCVAKARPAHEV